MIQIVTPVLIMFVYTVVLSALLIIPALKVHIKHDLTRFYWRGFWIFLMLIAAFSGGQQILKMAGVQVEAASTFYLAGLVAAYIAFVVFAWFRLTWVTLSAAGLKFFRRFNAVKTSE